MRKPIGDDPQRQLSWPWTAMLVVATSGSRQIDRRDVPGRALSSGLTGRGPTVCVISIARQARPNGRSMNGFLALHILASP